MQYAQHAVSGGRQMSYKQAWQADAAGGRSIGGRPAAITGATGRSSSQAVSAAPGGASTAWASEKCPPKQGLMIRRAGTLQVWAAVLF
jgi:hypothetical protein